MSFTSCKTEIRQFKFFDHSSLISRSRSALTSSAVWYQWSIDLPHIRMVSPCGAWTHDGHIIKSTMLRHVSWDRLSLLCYNNNCQFECRQSSTRPRYAWTCNFNIILLNWMFISIHWEKYFLYFKPLIFSSYSHSYSTKWQSFRNEQIFQTWNISPPANVIHAKLSKSKQATAHY